MATRAKAPVDPLIEELPPVPEESAPERAADVMFDVVITPYIVQGQQFFRWEITNHTHQEHVGSYLGHGNPSFKSVSEAEFDAREYVERIRHTLDIKLALPEPVRITI